MKQGPYSILYDTTLGTFSILQFEDIVPSRTHSRSHSRSSHQSHSSSSFQSSRGSKYSSMSEEDFEAEARKRGFEKKNKGESSEGNSKSCFDCFGRGSKTKESKILETVYEEESDQNFEFQPHTQLQFDEPSNRWTTDNTPDTTEPQTPNVTQTPNDTATTTPINMPPRTPVQQ